MTKKIKQIQDERPNPYRMDIADVGNDFFSIKCPILISKDRLEILNKICDITGEELQQYIRDALYQAVETDLENPSQFGQAVCETLLKQWGPTKDSK